MEPHIYLEINEREPITCREFQPTGQYETLIGTVHFAIDPTDPTNQHITDIEYAPLNTDDRVEFSTDFYLLKPLDLANGNRRLLYDVNNRGNKRILRFLNDAVEVNHPSEPEHFGNGFLMRQGYTILWTGWQGNIAPGDNRLTIDLPIAKQQGDSITGTTRMEFIADEPGIYTTPLSGNSYTESYPTASQNKQNASFTKREYESDKRIPIDSDDWAFATATSDGTVVKSCTDCYYDPGFTPGLIYELVYTAIDPPVMGLGFAGVRDVISFLLNREHDDDNTANPLANGIEAAYGWGRSQSGRFLREYVYQGFNEDHIGRQIFEAIAPHVAGAGRVALNYRFAQPGRYPRQHEEHVYPSDQFPFAYVETTDPFTGDTDSILKRPETDPLVVHTQTASEYWQRRGSLVHTDPEGNDLGQQPGVRCYLFASTQHAAGPQSEPDAGPHRYPTNPLGVTHLLRGVLDVLHNWASNDTAPPPSEVPTHADGTAVTAETTVAQFPAIPDVVLPRGANEIHRLDFGPKFDEGIIEQQPPKKLAAEQYPIFVPAVDDLGNETAGLRVPRLVAPTATFTGWNLREPGPAENAMKSITGSYFPLSRSPQESDDTTNTRPFISELYGSSAEYESKIEDAVDELIETGFMLEEDRTRLLDQIADIDSP